MAVERAVEVQERLHGHRELSVRIGIDMGEIRVEYDGEPIKGRVRAARRLGGQSHGYGGGLHQPEKRALRRREFPAIRVPDAVLRVSERENPSLIQALNSVANQWDFLFP